MRSTKRMSRVPEQPRGFLFDTVTLSNFALARRFDLLVTRYGKRLLVTPEVLDEITEGIIAGYRPLCVIEHAVDQGDVGRTGCLTAKAGRQAYRELLRILASGEASCIAHAVACGGVVVSDDRTARQCCRERDISVTGTIGILKACVMDGSLDVDDADGLLQAMVDSGYYSPVHSISDLM
jgi:predicted nucleic acid-binding protein